MYRRRLIGGLTIAGLSGCLRLQSGSSDDENSEPTDSEPDDDRTLTTSQNTQRRETEQVQREPTSTSQTESTQDTTTSNTTESTQDTTTSNTTESTQETTTTDQNNTDDTGDDNDEQEDEEEAEPRSISVEWSVDVVPRAATVDRGGESYITANSAGLQSFDITDGSQEWHTLKDIKVFFASPSIVGDTIYIAGRDENDGGGTVNAVERKTGREISRGDAEMTLKYIVASDDMIVVGSKLDTDTVSLSGYDTGSLEQQWQKDLNAQGIEDIEIHNGVAYVGFLNSTAAYRLADGHEFWSSNWSSRGLTIQDDLIYMSISAVPDEFQVVETGTRLGAINELWSIEIDEVVHPTLDNEGVILAHGDGVSKFNRDTGDEIWSVATTELGVIEAPTADQPTLFDGLVWIGNSSGMIWGLDPSTGETRVEDNLDVSINLIQSGVSNLIISTGSGILGVKPDSLI